jgi:hypothetical protein
MLKVLGVIIFAGSLMTISFKSGMYYEYYKTKPIEVALGCGYYDIKTGVYRRGTPPTIIDTTSQMGGFVK